MLVMVKKTTNLPLDTKYIEQFKASLPSQKSYENYVCRLKSLNKVTNLSFHETIINPEKTYPLIREKYPNISSRKNYIVPIMTAFRLNPDLQTKYKEAYQTWEKRLSELKSIEQANQDKNIIPETKKEDITTTEEVRLKVIELESSPNDQHQTKENSLRFLLLKILDDIHPKRADLGNVLIFRDKDPNINDKNYIVLKNKNDVDPSYLVLNKYKTANKYGRIDEDFKDTTADAIRTSLKRYPRKYLFVQFKKDIPYDKNNSYGRFVENTFYHFFGKKTGVSLWRHIFITEKIDPSESKEKRKENAKLMGHSETMAAEYRWDENTNTKKKNKKICICLPKDKAQALKTILT